MGYAIYYSITHDLLVGEIEFDSPSKQLKCLKDVINVNANGLHFENTLICFEKFVYLNGGARAIVPLVSRYGYIYYTLKEDNLFECEEINLASVRKQFNNEKGINKEDKKTKKQLVNDYYNQFSNVNLTDNETDAICLINKYFDINKVKIQKLEKLKLHKIKKGKKND